MRRRGLSPEGSPLCPALQGKYDDYVLLSKPKILIFEYLNFLVAFHDFEFVFNGFWSVFMAFRFCEFRNFISRKNVSEITTIQ